MPTLKMARSNLQSPCSRRDVTTVWPIQLGRAVRKPAIAGSPLQRATLKDNAYKRASKTL
jgi:hypothetical protein